MPEDTRTIAEVVGEFYDRVVDLEFSGNLATDEDINGLTEEIVAAIKARPDAESPLMDLVKRLQALLVRRRDVVGEQEKARRQKLFLARVGQYKKLVTAYAALPVTEVVPADLRGVVDALNALSQESPDAESKFEVVLLIKKAKDLLAKVEQSYGFVLPADQFGTPAASWNLPQAVPQSVTAPEWQTDVTLTKPIEKSTEEVLSSLTLEALGNLSRQLFSEGKPELADLVASWKVYPRKLTAEESAAIYPVALSAEGLLPEGSSILNTEDPENIAQSIQRKADALSAQGQAAVAAETMVADPTKAPPKDYGAPDQKLLTENRTYRHIYTAYPYPEGADWKRLTDFYLSLENRVAEDPERVAGGEEPLSPEALQLIGDLQSRAMSEINAGLIPYEISDRATEEARNAVRRVYTALAESKSGPATNEDRVSLSDAVYKCVAGLGCAGVPDYLSGAATKERGAIDLIVFRYTREVSSYWSSKGRRYIPGGDDAIKQQISSLLTDAVRDESSKPVTLQDYSAYIPETLDRTTAQALVKVFRDGINGRVDNFIENGVLREDLAALVPSATLHTDEVAIGMTALREKYGLKGFELFGTRGFLPQFVQTARLKAVAGGVRDAALSQITDLEAYVNSVVGLTPEELARTVRERIVTIDRDTWNGLLGAARASIGAQEVWDSLFAYCNEIQAINQVVYLGMFKGIQAAAGGVVRSAVANTPAGMQGTTEYWFSRASASLENDIKYGNYEAFKTHYIIKNGAASSILRYQNGVDEFAGAGYNGVAFRGGMASATKDAAGNFISDWVPELRTWQRAQVNPYTGALMTAEEWDAFLLKAYREARLAKGLDPNRLYPYKRVGVFDGPEEVSVARELWGGAEAPATAAANVLGAGGLPGFMMGFGPVGAIIGIGAAGVETLTDSILDKVQTKFAEMPMDQYSAELEPILKDLVSRAEAGENIDLEGTLEKFFADRGAQLAESLIKAEIDSMAPQDWEQMGADVPSTNISVGYALGQLVAEAYQIAGDPSSYPMAGQRASEILAEIKSLETADDMTPELLKEIQGYYTIVEQEVVMPILDIERGRLGGE